MYNAQVRFIHRVAIAAARPNCRFYRFRDKIVTGSFDKTAKVWCSRTGHCLATMWGHDAEVVVAKFSPTRCNLATGSIDATSKIFHIETGIENIAMLSHIIKARFDSASSRSIGRNILLSNPFSQCSNRACKQYGKAVNLFLYSIFVIVSNYCRLYVIAAAVRDLL